MAINPSAISSKPVTDPSVPAVIELLSAQPVDGQVFSPPRPPGQLVGWYNGSIDAVELYMVNGSGSRYLRLI